MLLVFVTRYDDGIYYVKVVLIKYNPGSLFVCAMPRTFVVTPCFTCFPHSTLTSKLLTLISLLKQ